MQSTLTTPSRTLLDRISSAIESSPYLPDGHVRFEAQNNGSVVLNGKVHSFFQKQMAQETVRRIDGVGTIENNLKVSWA